MSHCGSPASAGGGPVTGSPGHPQGHGTPPATAPACPICRRPGKQTIPSPDAWPRCRTPPRLEAQNLAQRPPAVDEEVPAPDRGIVPEVLPHQGLKASNDLRMSGGIAGKPHPAPRPATQHQDFRRRRPCRRQRPARHPRPPSPGAPPRQRPPPASSASSAANRR